MSAVWKVTFLLIPRDGKMKINDLISELKKRTPGPLHTLSVETVENGFYSVYYESDNQDIRQGLMKSLYPDFILDNYEERLNC